jgi:SAM-dependent methyltransferase
VSPGSYRDTLGDTFSDSDSPSQRAMRWTVLPLIYERAWRPLGFRLWTGGRSTEGEDRVTRAFLELRPDDAVLDVACGPGNTTRRLLPQLGPGARVVGVDTAPAMLERAVADTDDPRVEYVRADAADLPFADGEFDAVTCHGALYLVDDAEAVIAEMARVLTPGGRLAILTSCHRGPLPLRVAASAVAAPSGLRVFGRDEIPDALRAHGLTQINQDIQGFSQIVGARKP